MKIILASNSPRRRQLLSMICPDYLVADPRDVDEVYPAECPPEQVPLYLSKLKAEAYLHDLDPDAVLITADTVVILDGAILGKPACRDHAIEMLRSLRDRSHTVVTGVTLSRRGLPQRSFAEHTRVTFGHLADSEISHYVDTYKPFDKAGAYGVQEWVGGVGISHIDGCFYNVMGLPLHALYHNLNSYQKLIPEK
ncbi:MAG: Maf family nucleotide pyrophosphatase [Muribaculaceae bacterium]